MRIFIIVLVMMGLGFLTARWYFPHQAEPEPDQTLASQSAGTTQQKSAPHQVSSQAQTPVPQSTRQSMGGGQPMGQANQSANVQAKVATLLPDGSDPILSIRDIGSRMEEIRSNARSELDTEAPKFRGISAQSKTLKNLLGKYQGTIEFEDPNIPNHVVFAEFQMSGKNISGHLRISGSKMDSQTEFRESDPGRFIKVDPNQKSHSSDHAIWIETSGGNTWLEITPTSDSYQHYSGGMYTRDKSQDPPRFQWRGWVVLNRVP